MLCHGLMVRPVSGTVFCRVYLVLRLGTLWEAINAKKPWPLVGSWRYCAPVMGQYSAYLLYFTAILPKGQ
jgi:hypothetical protein